MAIAISSDSMTVPKQPTRSNFCCVACGHQRCSRKPVVRADPQRGALDLFRCVRCGLIQQHPRDPASQLTAPCPGHQIINESEASHWARAVQQYVVHLLPWESKPPKRLLNLGCGVGHLAALARRRGWRVIGIDNSPEAVSRAVVNFDLDARAGNLARYRSTLPPIDVAFLGDVIEYDLNPAALLEDVRAILASDGVVCIDTPNWPNRWRKLARARRLGLNACHVNLFDAGSLGSLLGRSGFSDIQTGSYSHYGNGAPSVQSDARVSVQPAPEPTTWRSYRLFNWFKRRNPWTTLKSNLPATLDDARRRVSEMACHRVAYTSKHTADNLIATARLR